jgi:hypothetical protein
MLPLRFNVPLLTVNVLRPVLFSATVPEVDSAIPVPERVPIVNPPELPLMVAPVVALKVASVLALAPVCVIVPKLVETDPVPEQLAKLRVLLPILSELLSVKAPDTLIPELAVRVQPLSTVKLQ